MVSLKKPSKPRTVHFANENVFIGSSQTIPSSLPSESSSPPPSPQPIHHGPSWPPDASTISQNYNPASSERERRALPHVPLSIHRILQSNFSYNLSVPWYIQHIFKDTSTLVMLDAFATYPPLKSLAIICYKLPWTITILPEARNTTGVVSVRDVFAGIHRALHIPVNEMELMREGTSRQSAIIRAYENRCRQLSNETSRSLERQMGIRRIDFLIEEHRFGGLQWAIGADHWILKVKA